EAIVVCDGDVMVEQDVTNALVVARGNIRVKRTAYDSVLVSGGNAKFGQPPALGDKVINRVVDAKTPPDAIPVKLKFATLLKEKEPHAFGFVTFFELATVGLEVNEADGDVKVAAVADGKPFAKAGVRVGDIITAVNA